MAVFRTLLERWGFVKLDRYGLVRTPDDRILSTRPAALDDGGGGRIVGWRDDDLAMAELAPCRTEGRAHAPARPHVQLPARQVITPPVERPAVPATPQRSSSAQNPGPVASRAVMPVAVAPEPAVDEDDWEWTIALARARAAAEEPQTPAVQAQPAQAAPIAGLTPAPPVDSALPQRKVRQPPAAEEPTQVGPFSMPIAPTVAPSVRSSTQATARNAPATVIPVPQLPSILDTGRAARFEPVVRTTVTAVAPAPPAPPNRLAKGTAPIDADTEQIPTVLSDDTEQSFAIGDRTKPGIGMPLAARAVALPSIRGRSERRG